MTVDYKLLQISSISSWTITLCSSSDRDGHGACSTVPVRSDAMKRKVLFVFSRQTN